MGFLIFFLLIVFLNLDSTKNDDESRNAYTRGLFEQIIKLILRFKVRVRSLNWNIDLSSRLFVLGSVGEDDRNSDELVLQGHFKAAHAEIRTQLRHYLASKAAHDLWKL